MSPHPAQTDWSSKRIAFELEQRANCTLSDIDRDRGLPPKTCANATYRPNLRGEIAISKTLKIAAHKIWPSRYDTAGKRLKPQPKSNYMAVDSQTTVDSREKIKLNNTVNNYSNSTVKNYSNSTANNYCSENNSSCKSGQQHRQKVVRG